MVKSYFIRLSRAIVTFIVKKTLEYALSLDAFSLAALTDF